VDFNPEIVGRGTTFYNNLIQRNVLINEAAVNYASVPFHEWHLKWESAFSRIRTNRYTYVKDLKGPLAFVMQEKHLPFSDDN